MWYGVAAQEVRESADFEGVADGASGGLSMPVMTAEVRMPMDPLGRTRRSANPWASSSGVFIECARARVYDAVDEAASAGGGLFGNDGGD